MNEREEKLLLFSMLMNVAVHQTSFDFWLTWSDRDEQGVPCKPTKQSQLLGSMVQKHLGEELQRLGRELWQLPPTD